MQQIDKVDYTVRNAEKVTIRVSAVGAGTNVGFCSVVFNGNILPGSSKSPKTYSFQITGNEGETQVATFMATFGHDAVSLSRYELFVSSGAPEFIGPRYFLADAGGIVALFFGVAA